MLTCQEACKATHERRCKVSAAVQKAADGTGGRPSTLLGDCSTELACASHQQEECRSLPPEHPPAHPVSSAEVSAEAVAPASNT